ncbi:hypothetical protein B9Z55_026736 [Caenorhabditis nigoni]|uniref:Uncharacterized protein n=1 Tax=Caenorhabditis nigoni TaxID=1611254 RepID=A0A2G5SH59_9PELO|nr:hypothetical protein B9Z55_026736 [Caenorhabditis nigoni]
MSEISESTISIEDEKSDILKKNVLGKSKKWNNEIFNIFIGFACLFYIYNHFTTYPNAEEHFQKFKCKKQTVEVFLEIKTVPDSLLSMPIWFSIYIFANGFGALVLWRISNMKRSYYGDEMYLVIYGGEESSTKKIEKN